MPPPFEVRGGFCREKTVGGVFVVQVGEEEVPIPQKDGLHFLNMFRNII